MKKSVKVLCLIVSMMLMVSILGACSKNETSKNDTNASKSEENKDSKSKDTTTSKKEKFKIVMVAKHEGIPWFDDMRLGVNDFGEKYADLVEAKQIAPEGGDPAKQVQMVEDLIAQGVDAIIVVPNDPQSMKPILQKAKDKGIITISHEATNLTDVVDYDIEAFKNEDFGKLMFENLATAMEGKGKFVAMVGGLTMQTHMEWYNAGMEYLAENYPEMEAVSDQPYEDKNDDTIARDKALEILKAYPDIKGFVGTSVSSGSNFAAVLKEKNRKDVAVVSLGIPSVSSAYINEGYMNHAQCWRPADVGYASCAAALKILQGDTIDNDTNLEAPGYENIVIDKENKIIYGDAPMILKEGQYEDANYPF
ncbi:autoinducer 2 ABC transporter substrate-binding protein [Vallitalea guaymasensis]|uniref:autoinducer 2 ABC transporter substrate-binding protein n=1 Tax=Vallitalea guaymasensis TaxID=1185412 RepID=UPI0019310514|nr:autoinducer 2 ABC transporter substrate-binding protein [Vallitalea guaymasensis]